MVVSRLALSRRTLVALAVAWVGLFVIAGTAANGNSTVDDVVWTVVWVALPVLIALAVLAVVQSRRSG
jgi:RsiW-degrading membrane proteinase PrsW (M82 family)